MNIRNVLGKRENINAGVEACRETPGAVLLDVRTPEEYAQGHIPGSFNLPLDQVEGITFSRDTPLFVYCLSGARSGRACAGLEQNGYDVRNIGGIMGYHGPLE